MWARGREDEGVYLRASLSPHSLFSSLCARRDVRVGAERGVEERGPASDELERESEETRGHLGQEDLWRPAALEREMERIETAKEKGGVLDWSEREWTGLALEERTSACG